MSCSVLDLPAWMQADLGTWTVPTWPGGHATVSAKAIALRVPAALRKGSCPHFAKPDFRIFVFLDDPVARLLAKSQRPLYCHTKPH